MNSTLLTQIWHFILHLRLHYQFFILSGGYLLSALFADEMNWNQYVLQFLNVHFLLFGGATAYNSYWDKDEGPIDGLKNPPKMTKWMWVVSLLMQFIGQLWALTLGWEFALIYLVSLILFWLYSTPHARWKGRPLLSLFVIAVSTGTNSFLMGRLASGAEQLSIHDGLIAFGVALVLVSLYPVSQIFQIEEDAKRGDKTFTMKFRLQGVKLFYVSLFMTGALIISWYLYELTDPYLGLAFGILSTISCINIGAILFRLKGKEEEYRKVMMIKFLASIGFLIFIFAGLIYKGIYM